MEGASGGLEFAGEEGVEAGVLGEVGFEELGEVDLVGGDEGGDGGDAFWAIVNLSFLLRVRTN